MFDLILKGGFVMDGHRSDRMDLGIRNGVIAALGNLEAEVSSDVIDVTGCYVTPGLIDYHLHIFAGGSQHSVAPDMAMLPNGVTTGVDGGTCGSANYEIFHKHIVKNAIARINAFINISEQGLISFSFNECVDPAYFKADAIKRLAEKYPDEIVGIKLRTSKEITAPLTYEPLERTIEIAQELHLPVIVHVSNPSFSIEKLAMMLRPGDVFCHMYQGKGETILDGRGNIRKGILEARGKGVLFDACNGNGNYSFDVAVPAMEQGFYPDILSTDIGPLTCYKSPVISLPYLMAKYMNMGMPLKQVVKMVTCTPARQIGKEELGYLDLGTAADIAVLKRKEQKVQFCDCTGRKVEGHEILVPQLTVKDGQIVYRQTDLT